MVIKGVVATISAYLMMAMIKKNAYTLEVGQEKKDLEI